MNAAGLSRAGIVGRPAPASNEPRPDHGVAALSSLPDRAGTLSILRTMVRNPLEAVPQGAYHKHHVTTRLMGRDVIYVAHPDIVRRVLLDDTAFGQGDGQKRALTPLLGDGVLTSEGPRWHQQRQAALPAMRNDVVQDLLPFMTGVAEQTCERLLARPGTQVDVGVEMMRTTLDIIVGALLPGYGTIDTVRFGHALSGYLEQATWHLALSLVRAPHWMPYPGRAGGDRAAKELRGIVAAVMQAGDQHAGLLGHLRAGAGHGGATLNEADMLDNVLTLIAAGHETTAVTLAWALHTLAAHPAIEDALLHEIMAVAPSGCLTTDQVAALPLTRRVIQETLRLYPAAPLLIRRVRTDTTIGIVRFRAGSVVFLPIYALHRHSAVWQDAERFDPARFLPEAVRERDRFAYLPFGAGPRVCIGANFAMTEAVTLLAVIVRRVALRSAPGCRPRPLMRVTLRPGGGISMLASPR